MVILSSVLSLAPVLALAIGAGACDHHTVVGRDLSSGRGGSSTTGLGGSSTTGLGGSGGGTWIGGWAGQGGTAAGAGGTVAAELFLPPVMYPATRAYQLAIGDLNGDPWPDVVVGCTPPREDPNVSVFLNVGGSELAPAQKYPAGDNPFRLAVGDLNGDGMGDVVATTSVDITVLFNGGNGVLKPQMFLETGPEPVGVALSDLDGDGWNDMIVAKASYLGLSGEIDVLMNRGAPTFDRAVYLKGGGNNYDMAIGDLTGDRRPDLVVVNSVADVLLNVGDGTFGPVAHFGTTRYPPSSVAIGDLNGDGLADIAANTNDAGSSGVSTFFNPGGGTFGASVDYRFGSAWSRGVTIGDVNADGLPDLVMLWSRDSETTIYPGLAVLLNQGKGSFGPPLWMPVEGIEALAVADLNRDGASDVVATTPLGILVFLARHESSPD
jgi:hypothetical protein